MHLKALLTAAALGTLTPALADVTDHSSHSGGAKARSSGEHEAEQTRRMLQAASLHRNGETSEAAAIWRRLANSGVADAAFNLGLIHYHADGVAKDYVEALRWFRQAAEWGDRESEYRVGWMMLHGEGVTANAEEAHQWMTRHRRHHFSHARSPQMMAWQQQARGLIQQRDLAESLARTDSGRVVAELRQRAGLGPANETHLASASDGIVPANRVSTR